MTNRAYSLVEVKALDEKKRVFRGWATTPEVDRASDTIDPMGAKFKNPLVLLHQHNHQEPIGTVTFKTPNANGIEFEAEIPVVSEPGPLKDRVDTAWGELKHGLVRAVSIGFRPLKFAYKDDGGVEFQEIEIYELSVVSVPANAGAVITGLKSLDPAAMAVIKEHDVGAPAATGTDDATTVKKAVSAKNPASGTKPTSIDLRPKDANEVTTVAEQITALEATRAAKAARMSEVMQKSIDAGRSTDAAEQEEFDTLEQEVEALDGDLKRLRALEKAQAANAKPVHAVKTQDEGASTRAGQPLAPVQVKKAESPGVRFARLAKVKAIARLNNEPAYAVAERMYGSDSEVVAITKAAVLPGTTASGNWAADLVGAETSAYADFAEFLRPATILGKFGQNGVPSLRRVPFREPLISQTGGGSGYWVGEGNAKPLTAFDFDRTTIEPLKVANIAVLTEENIRSSAPSSELIVRDSLRDALTATQDTAFFDPANSGSPGVKPASITNGAAAIASPGTDADSIRLGVRALFQKFIDADNPPETGVWIMSTTNALALSIMTNALGQREFPGITMTGGTFEGMPVIASRYAGTNVALVNASDIYEADDGGVDVDMSREASLQMDDNPDNPSTASTVMVSLFQRNLVALRAERTINWKRRRTSAVAYLTGTNWGGAVPAS